tara:strand:+ start:565 stop:1104 length:540 start_codon:yes stop_codon:yes gene_type:complete
MANGTLKVGTLTTSSGSGNITIGSGVTLQSNVPAFEAYLSSGQTINHQTNTKIQVDTEVFDTNGYYDNSTNYRFTPLVAGKYFVYSILMADTSTSNMKQFFNMIFKNGVNESDGASINFDNNNGEGGGVTQTTIVEMNGSTDYLELYTYGVTVNAGTFTTAGSGSTQKRTLFGAYRLGA